MKQELKLADKIWRILYPVGMYYVTIVVVMFCAQLFLGAGNETYMLCKIVGSLAAIFVVWSYYRQDLALAGKLGRKLPFSKAQMVNVLWIIGIILCISISLNNLISMSPLMNMSESYEDAANAFYGSNIWIELLGSALITPILEELLHRGVVFGRLRQMTGMWTAVLISALIFASLHFNLVQFTYAFLLGVVLALIMEKTDHLYGPILAHIAANAVAIIRTETGFLEGTVDKSIGAWAISIILLLAGIAGILIYGRSFLKKKSE